MSMFRFNLLIAEFFAWGWDRFKNPYVISGLVVMVLGIVLLATSNKLAYHITLHLKDADDKKLANVGLGVKVAALIVTIIGALLAVLFV